MLRIPRYVDDVLLIGAYNKDVKEHREDILTKMLYCFDNIFQSPLYLKHEKNINFIRTQEI